MFTKIKRPICRLILWLLSDTSWYKMLGKRVDITKPRVKGHVLVLDDDTGEELWLATLSPFEEWLVKDGGVPTPDHSNAHNTDSPDKGEYNDGRYV